MKLQKEPVPVFLFLCQWDLYLIEVCYLPWYCEVRGAEIYHQALQLLMAIAALRGCDDKQMVQLIKFSLRERYWDGLCVNLISQDFLHTSTVSLPLP